MVINDLTVSNGAGGNQLFGGAGIGFLEPRRGGGIYNLGDLTLHRVTIDACYAFPPSIGLVIGTGGGIYNEGTLTINDSTLSNNLADGSTELNTDSSTKGYGGGSSTRSEGW